MRSGQDVLVYAPRRYGKSSLVLRAAQEAIGEGILVGYCDLLRVTSKEGLAAALAKTIHSDIDSRAGQALERAAGLFRGLTISPAMRVDSDGSLSFTFSATRRSADIDQTIEALLDLLANGLTAAQVLEELRAVFQAQREVSHVYLGSKRHVLDRIFNDEHEPFWRSAKRLELGLIEPSKFAPFVRERFQATDKGIMDDALARLLAITGGHPYATQELAHEVWELVGAGSFAHETEVEVALQKVLRAENNHLEKLWDDASTSQRRLVVALAREPTASLYAEDYRSAHDLPAATTVQAALRGLEKREVVARDNAGTAIIVEPFFADWILRDERPPSLSAQLRLQ